jgi:hypothetical protein
MRLLAALFCSAFLLGCASTVVERHDAPSYHVGLNYTAAVGGVLLVSQHGSVEKVRHWVGILNSSDGWKTDDRYTADYVRKELVYSGRSGDNIEIGYREFRGGLAAPAFYQTVKYDLKASNRITFQNFQFDVLSATNESITARLARD